MKQLIQYLLLFVLLLFVRIPASAQKSEPPPRPADEYNTKAWQEFVSQNGRFAILMPGKPTETIKTFNTEVGTIKKSTYALQTGVAIYIVAYGDSVQALTDPKINKESFDSGRDEVLKLFNGRLLREKDIALSKYTGREYEIETPEVVCRIRAYAVGNRMYQLLIATQRYEHAPKEISDFHESVITKFLDSFKVLTPESIKIERQQQ